MSRTSCRSDIESGFGLPKRATRLLWSRRGRAGFSVSLRERRQLAMLDEGMLKDIGLSKPMPTANGAGRSGSAERTRWRRPARAARKSPPRLKRQRP